MTEKVYTFAADDIFQDIKDDPENVTMTIPPEILEKMGWKEGTNLSITWNDGSITLKEVDGKE
tara:strand:+ start:376 stop:564 length:189 start_codon:yes stop_codon:yes gene_type:complete